MLLWTKQFATGVPEIDEQHRQLIHNVNQLEGLLVRTNPSVEDVRFIGDFVDFLGSYIDSHFKFEEDCMVKYRCPVHQKNQTAHEHFRQLYQRFKELARKEGFRIEVLTELNQGINAWIQDHILRVDTQLNGCFRDRQG
jgi:hemerythrin